MNKIIKINFEGCPIEDAPKFKAQIENALSKCAESKVKPQVRNYNVKDIRNLSTAISALNVAFQQEVFSGHKVTVEFLNYPEADIEDDITRDYAYRVAQKAVADLTLEATK